MFTVEPRQNIGLVALQGSGARHNDGEHGREVQCDRLDSKQRMPSARADSQVIAETVSRVPRVRRLFCGLFGDFATRCCENSRATIPNQ